MPDKILRARLILTALHTGLTAALARCRQQHRAGMTEVVPGVLVAEEYLADGKLFALLDELVADPAPAGPRPETLPA